MMTTDWNNPQGDFDPVEKQVDLRVFLSQFSKNSAYQNSIFAVCSLRMLLVH